MPRSSAVKEATKAEAPSRGRRGRGGAVENRTSVFDPETFLSTQFEGKIDTRRVKLPEGEWRGQIEKIDLDSFDVQNGPNAGSKAHVLVVVWKITDPEFIAAAREDNDDPNLDENLFRVRQKMFLDFTAEGSLDFSRGRNIKLGYLREALGQNDGTPWSPNHLLNQQAIVNIVHTPNEKEPENPYAEVSKVSAL